MPPSCEKQVTGMWQRCAGPIYSCTLAGATRRERSLGGQAWRGTITALSLSVVRWAGRAAEDRMRVVFMRRA